MYVIAWQAGLNACAAIHYYTHTYMYVNTTALYVIINLQRLILSLNPLI